MNPEDQHPITTGAPGKKRLGRLPGGSFWIALALLAANATAWLGTAPAGAIHAVNPVLDPQIAEIREKMWSNQHQGERFSLLFTGKMASEAIAWYLDRHPNVPFSNPWVEIDETGIVGSGVIEVMGLRTPVFGKVTLGLQKGVITLRILEVGVAGARAPSFVLTAVENELMKQVDLARAMPVDLERLEMRHDGLWVEGTYR